MREMYDATFSLRGIVGRNIKGCRLAKFPGRGGAKRCAEEFGVSPQQWSPWETGKRLPDESRLAKLADFFGVTVEYLHQDHRPASQAVPGTASAANPAVPGESGRMPGAHGPVPPSAASARIMPFFCSVCCPLLMEWPAAERRRLLRLMEHFMGVGGGEDS